MNHMSCETRMPTGVASCVVGVEARVAEILVPGRRRRTDQSWLLPMQ
jgi:hypothetical protein